MKSLCRCSWLLTMSAVCLLPLTLSAQEDAPASDDGWPYWVGPTYTGVSDAQNLPAEWDPKGGEGSNVRWKVPVGSRSTPTIMNGRIYIINNSHEEEITKAGEKVICLDAETGDTIWEYNFNVYLSDVPIERVGWSSVVCDPETGNVYALGVCGYFCCLNGETGELVWDRSMHEEFGFLTTYGGRTNFPIIHENNVIVSAVVIGWGDYAKPCHRFVAMDKNNGQVVWFEGTRLFPYDTTYSAPVLAVIDGELQMIFGSGDGGVHGFQPRTGKELWKYDLSGHGLNATPLVVGNRVYMGHAEENLDTTEMGGIVCIDASKRGDLTKDGAIWKVTELFCGRSSPIHIDGRLYVADDRGKLHCLNAETGEEIGKEVRLGTMMRANLLYADGKIYAHEVNGRGYVLKPTDDGAEILHRFRFPSGEECHGSPIEYKNRIYIPTSGTLYCVANETSAEADGEQADLEEPNVLKGEASREADQDISHVQLVPRESLFRPGTRQAYHVRLYNSKGQWLRNATPEEVEFTIDGPGKIDENGRYEIAASDEQHAAAIVTAKVGEATGIARIRIVPDLNWAFNFDDGAIPQTWVGCSYRHVPLDWDLLSKLREEDRFTSDVYIYLWTEFTNFAPKRVIDDSTPKQPWTNFLRFLQLAEGADKPKTIDEAKAKFDGALNKLVEEKVLANFEWSTWDRPTGVEGETAKEPRLTVQRGERKIDGNGVLCKIMTIPLGTRSQGWMGHPDMHDYTVQTDILFFARTFRPDGSPVLPDGGVIGQRYTLDLMGAMQQLQTRTWTPQLNRFSESAEYEWKPDTWYTLKFRTAVEDGKAVLKGKVWPRGETEPEEWTVTATDEAPNVIGSPGLFGNAKDGEIFYDNLTITKNE
ncbi:MAG: PQQ-binding-like beta-propeller repeat protein [Planctomycetaceae bacterium]|nr:PQQ-binding-like beta-propeller repeat protein [Planctomycetaceae bacterium]